MAPATGPDLDRMAGLLDEALDAGAFGFSSGLEYPLGRACTTEENVALARVVRRRGGFYAIHTRDRDVRADAAFDEAFAIGRQTDVALNISHLTPRYGAPPGSAARALERIDAERAHGRDVTCDMHTRLHGLTKLVTALPPEALDGGVDALLARLRDPADPRRVPRLPRAAVQDGPDGRVGAADVVRGAAVAGAGSARTSAPSPRSAARSRSTRSWTSCSRPATTPRTSSGPAW